MQALRRWFVRLPRTNFRKIPKPFLLSTRHLRGDAARLPRTHFRKIPKIFLAVHEGSPKEATCSRSYRFPPPAKVSARP
jgi:hypothetical protein